jgi:hypothetical protein
MRKGKYREREEIGEREKIGERRKTGGRERERERERGEREREKENGGLKSKCERNMSESLRQGMVEKGEREQMR